jgi:hypothetical protein
MTDPLHPKQLDHFHKAAISLKLFSRAELSDDRNRSLIEKLYVDPLPNDQVFKTLLADNTSLIIGRKGTGKSTIFQRVQHEVRKNKSNVISAYMDIRNVFEASQIDPVSMGKLDGFDTAMSPDQLQRFLLYKRFFKTLIADVRDELKAQVDQNFLTRLRDRVTGTSAEVFEGLDKIIERLETPDYENIDGFISKQHKEKKAAHSEKKGSGSIRVKADPTAIGASIEGKIEAQASSKNSDEDTYTQLLMRVVGINEVLGELKNILSAIGVKSLYVFLDDFSELPEEAMHLLVDALISPLSRWSEFVKFKIAAYPGRIYLGSIDNTKVEVIDLDLYGLYGSAGVTKMEEKAIDFVRRVVEKRLQHFCKVEPEVYFNMRSTDLWKTLFYASMANPRIIGHLMLYAHEAHLIYGKKIGARAVQEASQKYFEDKVSPFFNTGKYKMVFEERSSIFSLKELLEIILKKARTIRQEASRSNAGSKVHPYSSHFYVSKEFDDVLHSLELAFFITKYFEQSDRAGIRVSVYALNHGLCMKYQIGFGRPTDAREDRLYFVERRFDYNGELRTYILQNQEIKCDSCGSEFDLDTLSALKTFSMRCPHCKDGHCKIVNLSKKYEDVIVSIQPELLLPDTELGIMQTLFNEQKNMVAAEIASELDCSGQLVGRRGKNLFERSLVLRSSVGNVYRYELSDQARAAYFSDPGANELEV